MASTSLDIKLRTAASADATLAALLGSPLSSFRWYGPQLPQGAAKPLVEVLQVSQIPQYSNTDLLTSAQYRMQFTIQDTDRERAMSVARAITQFLKTFNAYSTPASVSPLRPNRVVNIRIGPSEPQTDPITYWVTLDAMIWNTETT